MQVLTQPWQQDTAQPLQCLLVLGISKGLARGLIPRQSSVHYQALRPAGRQSCKGSFPAIPSKERQSLLPLIASTGEAPLQLLPQNQMPKAAVGMSALQLYIWKLLPSCLVAAELLFLALGGGQYHPFAHTSSVSSPFLEKRHLALIPSRILILRVSLPRASPGSCRLTELDSHYLPGLAHFTSSS